MKKQTNISIEEIRADIINPLSTRSFIVNKKAKREILKSISVVNGQTDIFGGVAVVDSSRLIVKKRIRNFFVFA